MLRKLQLVCHKRAQPKPSQHTHTTTRRADKSNIPQSECPPEPHTLSLGLGFHHMLRWLVSILSYSPASAIHPHSSWQGVPKSFGASPKEIARRFPNFQQPGPSLPADMESDRNPVFAEILREISGSNFVSRLPNYQCAFPLTPCRLAAQLP